MHEMSPTDIRIAFNETIDAFRRSYGETAKANAKHIINAVERYPWLLDQIPYDVLGCARCIVEGKEIGS